MMDGRNPAEGHQQLLPLAQRIAEAFPDDDGVVSWTIYDEPGAELLTPLAWIVRAIREADPLHRPELIRH